MRERAAIARAAALLNAKYGGITVDFLAAQRDDPGTAALGLRHRP